MKFLCLIIFMLASSAPLQATNVTVYEGKEDNPKSTDEDRIATLKESDILSIRDGRFYLDGQPFAEISFNKFDLLWQLYDQRPMDQTDSQHFDLTRERNPELLNCIIEANRRLREKLSETPNR